jgi:hypothetical protein
MFFWLLYLLTTRRGWCPGGGSECGWCHRLAALQRHSVRRPGCRLSQASLMPADLPGSADLSLLKSPVISVGVCGFSHSDAGRSTAAIHLQLCKLMLCKNYVIIPECII